MVLWKEKKFVIIYMLSMLNLTSARVSWWCPLLRHWVLVPWICSPAVSGHWRVMSSNLNSVVHWGLRSSVLPVSCQQLWRAWWSQYSWSGGSHPWGQWIIYGLSLLPGILWVRGLVVPLSGAWCFPSIRSFYCLGTGVGCCPPVTPTAGWRAAPPCPSWRNKCRCIWIGLWNS